MLPKAWRWLENYSQLKERLVIGLMSGTSADGIDSALVRLIGHRPNQVETMAFITLPYPKDVRNDVFYVSQKGDVETVCRLNFRLGELFAKASLLVVDKAGLTMKQVHLIGSHGQTIRHLPPQKLSHDKRSKRKYFQTASGRLGSTLQIAEPSVIAYKTGVPVVSNFRSKDMVAGGQGAPLVPLVDWILFHCLNKTRIAVNIGGIANLTILPANQPPDMVTAFDTGPGNMLIDSATRFLSGGRKLFDRGGAWAKRGQVNRNLIHRLMCHPFLQKPPPKSTGKEAFGESFLQKTLMQAEKLNLTRCDVIATLTAFTAESISDAVNRFVLPKVKDVDEIIVSGGGVKNLTLMEMLKKNLSPLNLRLSDEFGINSDAKEAVAFAVLAHRTVMGMSGNLPSATGASEPVILGCITLP